MGPSLLIIGTTRLGSNYNSFFPEMIVVGILNNLGFFVLGKKQFTRAEAMFTMNTKNCPRFLLAYSYLGDLFAAKGDIPRAVASYKK